MFLARIRVSGEVGGMLIVAAVGIIFAGLVTSIVDFIAKHAFKENPTGKKVCSIIDTIVWVGSIVAIALDLTGVFPIIRNIIYMFIG